MCCSNSSWTYSNNSWTYSNSSWTYSASAMSFLHFWESSPVALDKNITHLIRHFLLLCPDVYKLCITAAVSVLLLVLKLDIPHHDFLMAVLGVSRFILRVHSGHQHPVHTLYPLSSSSSVLMDSWKNAEDNQNQIHRNCYQEERYSHPKAQVTEAGGWSSSLSSAT